MKMFNKERKFAVMIVQNHSWIYPCPTQFMDKEMHCMMNLCITSLLEDSMFETHHPCSGSSILRLEIAFLQKYMDEWMNVYSIICTIKCMNICIFQFLCTSMPELVHLFMNQLIRKLIKSVNIIFNIKN